MNIRDMEKLGSYDEAVIMLPRLASFANSDGELVKPNGDYYTTVSLGLAVYKLGKLRHWPNPHISPTELTRYANAVMHLAVNGYVRIEQNPYRLILTDKYQNETKGEKQCQSK